MVLDLTTTNGRSNVDRTVKLRNKVFVQDLFESDKLIHSCFQKVHLQRVVNIHYLVFLCIIRGHNDFQKVETLKFLSTI